jgi:SET domain-containing protein
MTSDQPPIYTAGSPIQGTGGFAARDFAAGERIIQYVGERISKEESLLRCEAENWCIFSLDDEWDLDGAVDWNPARFINHCCAPNCDAECDEGQIWIIARRDIARGEELSFNYGYDLIEYREHPCRCGATNCVGFIVADEFHDAIRQRENASR